MKLITKLLKSNSSVLVGHNEEAQKNIELLDEASSCKDHGSSALIQGLFQDDKYKKNYYKKFFTAYKQAVKYFKEHNYELAKTKADEALYELEKVTSLTSASVNEYIDVFTLLEYIKKFSKEFS